MYLFWRWMWKVGIPAHRASPVGKKRQGKQTACPALYGFGVIICPKGVTLNTLRHFGFCGYPFPFLPPQFRRADSMGGLAIALTVILGFKINVAVLTSPGIKPLGFLGLRRALYGFGASGKDKSAGWGMFAGESAGTSCGAGVGWGALAGTSCGAGVVCW